MILGLSIGTLLAVLAGGILAGFLSYAVGAASLVAYPLLLALGVPPVVANASGTIGILSGLIGSAITARRDLGGQRSRVMHYLIKGLVGGSLGALLLVELPAKTFEFAVPVLVLFSAVLIIVNPTERMRRRAAVAAVAQQRAEQEARRAREAQEEGGARADCAVGRIAGVGGAAVTGRTAEVAEMGRVAEVAGAGGVGRATVAGRATGAGEVAGVAEVAGTGEIGGIGEITRTGETIGTIGPKPSAVAKENYPAKDPLWLHIATWLVAVYNGYFGAGGGTTALALFDAAHIAPFHQINALKTFLGVGANVAALIVFTVRGSIDWPIALTMCVSTFIGGYLAPPLVRRIPSKIMRVITALGGIALSVSLAVTAYL